VFAKIIVESKLYTNLGHKPPSSSFPAPSYFHICPATFNGFSYFNVRWDAILTKHTSKGCDINVATIVAKNKLFTLFLWSKNREFVTCWLCKNVEICKYDTRKMMSLITP
jgi:hypothetical protein